LGVQVDVVPKLALILEAILDLLLDINLGSALSKGIANNLCDKSGPYFQKTIFAQNLRFMLLSSNLIFPNQYKKN
jgi:hypothetical protein